MYGVSSSKLNSSVGDDAVNDWSSSSLLLLSVTSANQMFLNAVWNRERWWRNSVSVGIREVFSNVVQHFVNSDFLSVEHPLVDFKSGIVVIEF